MKTMKDVDILIDKKEYFPFLNELIDSHENIELLDELLSNYDQASKSYILADLIIRLRRKNIKVDTILKHFNIPHKKPVFDSNLVNELIDFEMSFLYDLLKSTNEMKLSMDFTIDDPDILKQLEGMNEEQVKDFLFDKGFLNQSKISFTFINLLQDFLTYISYAIQASYDKLPQISYSLIRRPFIDSLYYFERLLIDSDKLVDDIMSDNANSKEITTKKQKDIFNKLLSMDYDLDLYSSVIYLLIDDSYHSLKHLSDKALHIATSRGTKKNLSGELNFIYLNDKIINEHLRYFYLQISFLLPFASRIISLNYQKIFSVADEVKKAFEEHHKKAFDLFLKYSKIAESIKQS